MLVSGKPPTITVRHEFNKGTTLDPIDWEMAQRSF